MANDPSRRFDHVSLPASPDECGVAVPAPEPLPSDKQAVSAEGSHNGLAGHDPRAQSAGLARAGSSQEFKRHLDGDGAIAVVKGFLHKAVDLAMAVLSKPGMGVYARGTDLVRPVTHGEKPPTLTLRKRSEGITRQSGAVVITPFSEASLIEVLTRHSMFKKPDGRTKEGWMYIDCPVEVARIILANKGHGWTVPWLKSVISAPTMRPDGSIITKPGYDEATGLLLVGNQKWLQVPAKPSRKDAVAALDVLIEPIKELPFADDASRAAALALLITAVMRPSLKTAPMFAVTAPAAGTGKSLTIDVASIMATGCKAAGVTPTPDEAELEKRIGAAMLAGDQVLNIDNVAHILKSEQLCQMLTSEEVKVRVLGKSKSVNVLSTSLICSTGNNLALHGDLNRRVVMIRLDAKCERPADREFDFDPTDIALSRRAEMVAAALTVIRAYRLAGSPGRAPPMGSFEDWSDSVRSALMWLNMGDCRGDVAAIYNDDPEKTELADILEALPAGWFTAREVGELVNYRTDAPPTYQTAEEKSKRQTAMDLREALGATFNRSGAFSTKAFGRYLKRYTGTIVGGQCIQKVSSDGIHGVVWQVVSVDDR